MQPFYHLRPNKCIDRHLFQQTLIGLSRFLDIHDYKYIGFGSFMFDDFKLLHDTLNISRMVSLEIDPEVYERAKYNLPYKCISVVNTSSDQYIAELALEDNDHSIFWLDYTNPRDLGMQLADFASLLGKLNSLDIVRITLNANPASLGEPDNRCQTLKERVVEQYLPNNLDTINFTHREYPKVLLQILKSIATQILMGNPPYSPNYLLPLFSCVYKDGQQMLTFTGIVVASEQNEEDVRRALTGFPHNSFKWDDPCVIKVPALTIRELSNLSRHLPVCLGAEELIEQFPFLFSKKDKESIESYIKYYKYYPHYHQVRF
jgi:hypothetical protein